MQQTPRMRSRLAKPPKFPISKTLAGQDSQMQMTASSFFFNTISPSVIPQTSWKSGATMYSPHVSAMIATLAGRSSSTNIHANRNAAGEPYARSRYAYSPPLSGMIVPSSAKDSAPGYVNECTNQCTNQCTNEYFRPQPCTKKLYWAGTTWANEMNE